ncbi:MAG TPA: hypothetical protein IAC12_01795 [Candidatus Aphodovivens avistercoris]|nr:hypothetical protein [Candidatus Aphodovivens avistercoris]
MMVRFGAAGANRAGAGAAARGAVLPPDERIHCAYAALSGARRRAYEDICRALAEGRPRARVRGMASADEAFEVLRMVKADHPEVHWLGSGASIAVGLGFAEVSVARCADARPDDDARLAAAAEAFLSALPAGAGEYECAKRAFSQVAGGTRYDFAARDADDGGPAGMRPFEATGALLDSSAVCAGFAKGVQLLLQRAGVMAALVSGEARSASDPDDAWGSHAWLVARIEGRFYHMDPTWASLSADRAAATGAQGVSFDYFCLTDAEISATHRVTAAPFPVPACTATAAEYYRREGLCLRAWDAGRYADMVGRQLAAGASGAAVKAASDAVYAKMEREVVHGRGGWRTLERVSALTGADYRGANLRFVLNPQLRILTLLVA